MDHSTPDLSTSPLLRSTQITRDDATAELPPLTHAFDTERKRLQSEGPREDGFTLWVGSAGRGRVHAGSLPSLARAEAAVALARDRGAEPTGIQKITETPSIPVRAVMECFYGPPWTATDRDAVLAAAVARGANTYVYGPSADQRTGAAWRVAYDGRAREDLDQLVHTTRAAGVHAIWRVSPSAPLEPSRALRGDDSADVRLLVGTVERMLGMGFDRVLIAFDDLELTHRDMTSPDGEHPLAVRHASVMEALVDGVGADRLLLCPTHYWGVESSFYRRTLARLLDQGLDVCWTGPDVISRRITTDQLEEVSRQMERGLWLWDNYPVNDWDLDGLGRGLRIGDMPTGNLGVSRRLPLAPLDGRSPDVGRLLAGYGANAAVGAQSGIPALQTALDWAWLGRAYDPERSWQAAVETVTTQTDALRVLADATGPVAAGAARGAGALAQMCARALLAYPAGPDARLCDEIISEAEASIAASYSLLAEATAFTVELRPWIMELVRQSSLAKSAAVALHPDTRAYSHLVEPLTDLLDARPTAVMCSNVPEALATLARGLIAGGAPDRPL